MSIRHEHSTHRYAAVSFAVGQDAGVQRSFAQILQRPVEVVEVPAGGTSPEDSDTGTEPLGAFLERFEPIRQQLAVRRLRGEQLGQKEALVLDTLNSLLDASFVPMAPEPADVTQAMSEARQLLKKYADG